MFIDFEDSYKELMTVLSNAGYTEYDADLLLYRFYKDQQYHYTTLDKNINYYRTHVHDNFSALEEGLSDKTLSHYIPSDSWYEMEAGLLADDDLFEDDGKDTEGD